MPSKVWVSACQGPSQEKGNRGRVRGGRAGVKSGMEDRGQKSVYGGQDPSQERGTGQGPSQGMREKGTRER